MDLNHCPRLEGSEGLGVSSGLITMNLVPVGKGKFPCLTGEDPLLPEEEFARHQGDRISQISDKQDLGWGQFSIPVSGISVLEEGCNKVFSV